MPLHWQHADAQAYWACQRCQAMQPHHVQGPCCTHPQVAITGRPVPIDRARADHGPCGRDGWHFQFAYHDPR